uniref:Uncharacterized protein n=1 Tax=Trichogramma kaykai TaxID=54128 RepID=A0ABD2X9D8_9HYME
MPVIKGEISIRAEHPRVAPTFATVQIAREPRAARCCTPILWVLQAADDSKRCNWARGERETAESRVQQSEAMQISSYAAQQLSAINRRRTDLCDCVLTMIIRVCT